MSDPLTEVQSFGYRSHEDRIQLRRFVAFHWTHYRHDPGYVPLLDYEYLGSRVLGITGFFEARNRFFTHGDARFFLVLRDGEVVGRCTAFVNAHHNCHARDRTGFFGHFECIDDLASARALWQAVEQWLRARGMTAARGPQNFPINEATPGFLVEGFHSRPVIYYHFNKPYYASLAGACGYHPVMHYRSWECPVPPQHVDRSFGLACDRIVARYGVTIEHWRERPLSTRRQEMFEVYNDAWHDNWGFVPFDREEFYRIIDDMQLVIDPQLFLFVYVQGQLAAFLGGVPNLCERLSTEGRSHVPELWRAARLLLGKSSIRGFRLGYLGVKKRFRRLGLDAVSLWRQQRVAAERGYAYCDLGWVLETNHAVIRMAQRFGAVPSKTYALFEKDF
jgi:hypothetical protein